MSADSPTEERWTLWVCPKHRAVRVEVTKGGSYCRECESNTDAVAVPVVPAFQVEALEKRLAELQNVKTGVAKLSAAESTRANALQAEVEVLRDALSLIAEHPEVQRNPDGDDQAAASMKFIAAEYLALSPQPEEPA